MSRVTSLWCLGVVLPIFALVLGSAPVRAQAPQSAPILLDQARITLGDVVEGELSEEVGEVDLGPTPPPGGSRILTRAQIQRTLLSLGKKADLSHVAPSVRVVSAHRVIKPEELAKEVSPAMKRLLKKGVRLKSIRATRSVKVAPRASLSAVERPRIPRREGTHRVTSTAGVITDGAVTQRVALTCVVEVTAEGARPDVQRGAEVVLVIARGSARISATAKILADADVGEVVSFRVEKTRAVLRAKLVSKTLAEVVGK